MTTHFDVALSRFRDRQQVSAEKVCWPWHQGVGASGYGVLTVQINFVKKTFSTHRLAWIAAFGPIPDGLLVCHACDNRLCVNPHHLMLATARANSIDMSQKGRARPRGSDQRAPGGQCKRGHDYSPENTYTSPSGARNCRPCAAELRRAS